MSLKNSKTLRKCKENVQPQMPELQFSKMLPCSRTMEKMQK